MEYANAIKSLLKIIVFFASLIFMGSYVFNLWRTNFRQLVEGTYIWNWFETPIMLSPLLILFLFAIYVGVKIFEGIKEKEQQ